MYLKMMRIYLDDLHLRAAEIPITAKTTCGDVIERCKVPGDKRTFKLVELWRGHERSLHHDEKPLEILMSWGSCRDEVRFYLRQSAALFISVESKDQCGPVINQRYSDSQYNQQLQALTIDQLRQFKQQQQQLIAKEQRMKYLKQQHALRQANSVLRNSPLTEERLKKLIASRGKNTYNHTNSEVLAEDLQLSTKVFRLQEQEIAEAKTNLESLTQHLDNQLSDTTYRPNEVLNLLKKDLELHRQRTGKQRNILATKQELLIERQRDIDRLDLQIAALQRVVRDKIGTSTSTKAIGHVKKHGQIAQSGKDALLTQQSCKDSSGHEFGSVVDGIIQTSISYSNEFVDATLGGHLSDSPSNNENSLCCNSRLPSHVKSPIGAQSSSVKPVEVQCMFASKSIIASTYLSRRRPVFLTDSDQTVLLFQSPCVTQLEPTEPGHLLGQLQTKPISCTVENYQLTSSAAVFTESSAVSNRSVNRYTMPVEAASATRIGSQESDATRLVLRSVTKDTVLNEGSVALNIPSESLPFISRQSTKSQFSPPLISWELKSCSIPSSNIKCRKLHDKPSTELIAENQGDCNQVQGKLNCSTGAVSDVTFNSDWREVVAIEKVDDTVDGPSPASAVYFGNHSACVTSVSQVISSEPCQSSVFAKVNAVQTCASDTLITAHSIDSIKKKAVVDSAVKSAWISVSNSVADIGSRDDALSTDQQSRLCPSSPRLTRRRLSNDNTTAARHTELCSNESYVKRPIELPVHTSSSALKLETKVSSLQQNHSVGVETDFHSSSGLPQSVTDQEKCCSKITVNKDCVKHTFDTFATDLMLEFAPSIETEVEPLEGEPESSISVLAKKKGFKKVIHHVKFSPLALLLDASLEGELELVKSTVKMVENPSIANDEGITAMHNAVCAGHYDIVKFLIGLGCDVNAIDNDGWTPLHCAVTCNNLEMIRLLVDNGAAIYAKTFSDNESAADKCEAGDGSFEAVRKYLSELQDNIGVLNNATVYAVYDYDAARTDELSCRNGDKLIVLRKGDDVEKEWWWCRLNAREGYIPQNYIALSPRFTLQRTESQT